MNEWKVDGRGLKGTDIQKTPDVSTITGTSSFSNLHGLVITGGRVVGCMLRTLLNHVFMRLRERVVYCTKDSQTRCDRRRSLIKCE